MRKSTTVLLLLICLQQTALSQAKRIFLPNGETFFSYERKEVTVNRMAVIPPIAFIYQINKRDEFEYDSVLSVSTARLSGKVLRTNLPDTIQKEYLALDYERMPEVLSTMAAICNSTTKKKHAQELTLPDSFLKHFDTAQVRYVFCFLHTGFARTEKNFQTEGPRKQVRSFIFSLGAVRVYPIKNKASSYCCILDLKNRNIVYFAHARHENTEAVEEHTLRYMVNNLVKHYFM